MPYYIKRSTKAKSDNARLIAKLDRIFSLYIRLRDSAPFRHQAFRCISCGQVKPFEQADCGHFFSRRHMATRFDEDNCWCECRHCLTPDTLVLTSDLRWVELGTVKVGDVLFGFDEDITHKTSRRYKESVVTHVHKEMRVVYEVEMENGDIVHATGDHKWLVRNKVGSSYKWSKTEDLWINGRNALGKKKTGPHTGHITSTICKIFQVIKQDMSYESGWIAGMIDADGHITQQNIHNPDGTIMYGLRIGVAQSEKYMDICHRIVSALEKFTDNHKPCRQWMDGRHSKLGANYQTWQFLITGTNIEKLQFLMRTRPNKMNKIDINKIGKIKSQYDTKVKSIKCIGERDVVVMETSTHTFIANGYAMHNCNRFSADHLHAYESNLKSKIGEERFSLLEWRAHQTKKWHPFELQQLITHYTEEVRKLTENK